MGKKLQTWDHSVHISIVAFLKVLIRGQCIFLVSVLCERLNIRELPLTFTEPISMLEALIYPASHFFRTEKAFLQRFLSTPSLQTVCDPPLHGVRYAETRQVSSLLTPLLELTGRKLKDVMEIYILSWKKIIKEYITIIYVNWLLV